MAVSSIYLGWKGGWHGAAALDVAPAITTSGELRFGINLLHPPADLVLANPGDAKRFMSDLLAGEKLRLDGEARWLAGSRLPFAENGRLVVTVTAERRTPKPGELIYHPVATSRGKLTVIGLGPGGEYAIHGTNMPKTVGTAASYGCFRMHNGDVIDLYARVQMGTPVVVLP